MQHKKSTDSAFDSILIKRSLRRSRSRMKVAQYLFDISPHSSYTSEIAQQTNLAPVSVTGSLHGDSQYRKDASLIHLNLVEKYNTNNMRLYRMTEFGKEVMKSMKKTR